MKLQLRLSSEEVELLKQFNLSTPMDVIDFYRRIKHPLLERLYLKTVGAYQLV